MTKEIPIRMDKASMALQWAVYSFMPESIALRNDPSNEALQLGLILSSNILLALSAELALKGLKQKETSVHGYEHTHDLLFLFRSLSDANQGKLAMRFQKYIDEDPKTQNADTSLESFLEKHRDDFVQWRYLDGNVDGLSSAPIEFHYVICAILDEVYSDDVGRN